MNLFFFLFVYICETGFNFMYEEVMIWMILKHSLQVTETQ